jgi:5-methylcytosine-specific restriction endonuclease McrA
MDEQSIFPAICPVDGWRVIGCAPKGCRFLKRTPVHHYLYCAHPERDLECYRKNIDMPFHRERYPADWEEISLRIRARSGGRCEFCGAENYKPHPVTGSRVVLTVAHLDHDPQNCSDENLRALCQRCHLRYDARHHARNAAATRYRKKVASGQLELIPRL